MSKRKVERRRRPRPRYATRSEIDAIYRLFDDRADMIAKLQQASATQIQRAGEMQAQLDRLEQIIRKLMGTS